jgi:hypothetical protein
LFGAALSATAAGAWQQAVAGRTFWLADNPNHSRLLVSRGLPSRADFMQMFGASAREPGTVTVF